MKNQKRKAIIFDIAKLESVNLKSVEIKLSEDNTRVQITWELNGISDGVNMSEKTFMLMLHRFFHEWDVFS